jgi:hypothetical protein
MRRLRARQADSGKRRWLFYACGKRRWLKFADGYLAHHAGARVVCEERDGEALLVRRGRRWHMWARVLFPGGETSRTEVIPQVCEQARERSRSEYRTDILNKRKTRKKCAALSFDRSTGTGTCTGTRYTSWVETTGTGTARDCKLGTSGIRRHPAMKSGPRDYESHLT